MGSTHGEPVPGARARLGLGNACGSADEPVRMTPIGCLENAPADAGRIQSTAEKTGKPHVTGGASMARETKWKRLWADWKALKSANEGLTRKQAAELLGVGDVTLWRLERHYATRGFESRTCNCGRNSQWDALARADSAFGAKLTELYVATIGASGQPQARGRRTAKMATALTCMANEPECPSELAERLRRGKFPVCLQRFLKRLTPELENRVRGPKHYQLAGLTSRRDLTVRFANGERAEMPAGFKWVFDDMSSNQPFWCLLRGKNEQMLFSRQGLYCIDHRALRWLGKMLVARAREAYRAEDILRFLRDLFELYGKPDMIVFEQ